MSTRAPFVQQRANQIAADEPRAADDEDCSASRCARPGSSDFRWVNVSSTP